MMLLLQASAPPTITKSFTPAADLPNSNRLEEPLFNVRFAKIVKVPTALLPGESAAVELMAMLPLTWPIPLNVAPAAMVNDEPLNPLESSVAPLLAILMELASLPLPLTATVPLLMIVTPENVLYPDKVNVPVPVFTRFPLPINEPP